jgi:palmitoyltransferase ZDHHC9/14/18
VCRPADGGGGGNPVAVVNEYSDSSEGRQSPALEPALLTDEKCYGATKPYSDFNFVFRDGKLVFGPQIHQLVASIILATFPVVLQTVTYGEDMHPACMAGCMSSLLVCAGTDPGIVPKRYHAVNCPVKQQVSLPDGRVVGIRYCYSCCIYRGPRTHHCGICDNCVDQFDHHCPWTGTCIGWRNYRSFLAFIHSLNLTAMLLVVFAVVVTCDVSKRRRLSVLSSMKVLHWAPAVILGYVFLAVNSVTGLLLVHWYLIVHNLTTAEHLKSTFGDSPNIWDAGCFENTKLKMSGRTDFYVDSGQYRFKLVEVIRKIIAMQRLEADEDGSDAE